MKTLLNHQIEDAQFLASKRFAGNFSGMGSGKTLTALEAFRLARKLVTDQVIIVGPPISLRMWASEFEAFFPGDKAQLVKTGKTKLDGSASALVMSYEIATKRAAELSQLKARALICDESHALKSTGSKRTKAILGNGGLSQSVDHAWMLTGTPATRYSDDLYPFLINADMQGLKRRCGGVDKKRFEQVFCVTQMKRLPHIRFPIRQVVGSRNTDQLNSWIYADGLAIRRELKDVWDAMPAITRQAYAITPKMSADVRALMKAVEEKSPEEISLMEKSSDPALATIMREIGMSKVDAAVDYIVSLVEDRAIEGGVLVGAWHTDVIDAIRGGLSAHNIAANVIDGRSSTSSRADGQRCFNDRTVSVLIGQIAAMGVSLNLQEGGSTIVTVEENWSPAVMDQFYARLHRMGQKDHVNVINLRTDLKIEKALVRIAARKTRDHNSINQQED
ncbi:MAG: DEAD/DEAH box helicase [Actinomycetota bacterium]|nr:DEAD/DEAH box helicase [Actinomycetota bacterium]